MRGHRRRLTAAMVIAMVLLVPAIIWSGMQQSGTKTPNGISKTPNIATVGPDMTPYVMTAQERAKQALSAANGPVLDHPERMVEPRSTIGSTGPYPGMTQAEFDKLARWKELARGDHPAVITEQQEPSSRIEYVPRPPGIEGLTPQERAKLEAYLKNQNR